MGQDKLTCTQDIAMSLAHSSAAGTTPGQSTEGLKRKKILKKKKSNKMQVKQKCACNSSLTNNRLKSEKRKIEKKKIKKTQTHTFNREEKATVNEGRRDIKLPECADSHGLWQEAEFGGR